MTRLTGFVHRPVYRLKRDCRPSQAATETPTLDELGEVASIVLGAAGDIGGGERRDGDCWEHMDKVCRGGQGRWVLMCFFFFEPPGQKW